MNKKPTLDENSKQRIRMFGMKLIDHANELYSMGIREMPSDILTPLRETVKILNENFPKDEAVQKSVALGQKILDTVQPLEFLPNPGDIQIL